MPRNQKKQQQQIELPLLDQACRILAEASYFAVVPLLEPRAQVGVARRAIKAKSSSNVRLANGTYASLFFDPSTHVPLTPLIVESDAQSLLFAFQNALHLFQRVQQAVAAFDAAKSNSVSILQVVQGSILEIFQVMAHARTVVCKMPVLLCGSSQNVHMLLELRDWAVRLKELVVAEVQQQRRRQQEEENQQDTTNQPTTSSSRPPSGKKRQQPKSNNHSSSRPTSARQDDDDGSAEEEHNHHHRHHRHDDALQTTEDLDLLAEIADCQGLLFSDVSWCPPAVRADLRHAEHWLLIEEMPYICRSLKDMIGRFEAHKVMGLLSCYASVMEECGVFSPVTAARQQQTRNPKQQQQQQHHQYTSRLATSSSRAHQTRNSSSRARTDQQQQHHDDDDDDDADDGYFDLESPSSHHDQRQRQQHDDDAEEAEQQHALRQLQLSLQRMQLFTGARVAAQTWLAQGGAGAGGDAATDKTSHDAMTVNNNAKQATMITRNLPEHIRNSQRFQDSDTVSTIDQMMLIATTVQALRATFVTWRRWLRWKKDRLARVDGIMRKNAAQHCLWRLRVWFAFQQQRRTARRATYGLRGKGGGAHNSRLKDDDVLRLEHVGTQTLQHQKTFNLRIGA